MWRRNAIYVAKRSTILHVPTFTKLEMLNSIMFSLLQRNAPKPGSKYVQYRHKFMYAPLKHSTTVTELIFAKPIFGRQLVVKDSDTEFRVNRTRGLAADTRFWADGSGLHTRGLFLLSQERPIMVFS